MELKIAISILVGLMALSGSVVTGYQWLDTTYAKQNDLIVVTMQAQDALDARIEDVTRRIVLIERRAKEGTAASYELQELPLLKRELERLRNLRYGRR